MRLTDRIEKRLHRLAVPGIFKWVALLGVIIYFAQFINSDISRILAFDKAAILKGELWRPFTFILDSGFTGFSMWVAIFLFFAVFIAFLMNDTLEEVWGATRLTLYILTSWLALAVAHWVLPLSGGGSGAYLYSAVFFAFATYVPDYTFLLFLIIPVKVRWLAWLTLGLHVYSAITNPPLFLLLFAICLPYLIWVLPQYLREKQNEVQGEARRRKFQEDHGNDHEPFHRCATCQRTEKDDPTLDFRTFPDGTEYCTEHLPKS